jgi:hypothetical protein
MKRYISTLAILSTVVFIVCASTLDDAAAGMSREQAREECKKNFPNDWTLKGDKKYMIRKNCILEKMKSKN